MPATTGHIFRGSLLNKAGTDEAFLARHRDTTTKDVEDHARGRRDSMNDDDETDANESVDLMSPALLRVRSVFKNKFCGDLFSSAPKSYEGALYKSRITTSKETANAVDESLDFESDDEVSPNGENGAKGARPASRDEAELAKQSAADAASTGPGDMEGHDVLDGRAAHRDLQEDAVETRQKRVSSSTRELSTAAIRRSTTSPRTTATSPTSTPRGGSSSLLRCGTTVAARATSRTCWTRARSSRSAGSRAWTTTASAARWPRRCRI